MKPDNTFFTLRCWRQSDAEKEFVRKIYATNLLTPRERCTMASYHSATYLRLHSFLDHYELLKSTTEYLYPITPEKEEQDSAVVIKLENAASEALRAGWTVFDSLAHEINLIAWKQAGRRELYHPYVQEKKISFYMVRERLLASNKLQHTPLCQLLATETRNPETRAEYYILLSNLAMRAQHRPILLGCRWQHQSEDNKIAILISESEGMPNDPGVNLHDVELVSSLAAIGNWLESFIDRVYQAASASL